MLILVNSLKISALRVTMVVDYELKHTHYRWLSWGFRIYLTHCCNKGVSETNAEVTNNENLKIQSMLLCAVNLLARILYINGHERTSRYTNF